MKHSQPLDSPTHQFIMSPSNLRDTAGQRGLNLTALVFSILLPCGAAHAGIIQVGGMDAGPNGRVSNKPGVCTVNFNGGNASNACGVTYTAAGGAVPSSNFRSGSTSTAAAPAGDTTIYLSVGPSDGTPITISLATPVNYFGFFAGSLDSYNLVQFFMGGVMVDAFTGTQINQVAFPSTSANGAGTAFIDYFPNAFYDRIVYSSSADAFETDNHAFGLASPAVVPEPGTLALFGIAALSLAGVRRRKSAI